MTTLQQRAALIKLVIFDVDGVLTDRKIYFSDDGREFKAFNSLDGQGIKLLQQSGVQVAIITARNSPLVARRMTELGVTLVYQGYADKRSALNELAQTLSLSLNQIAYLGDDLPDLPLMRRVGLGIAVSDACHYVVQHADHVTQAAGGKGAAREVCELIMQAQGTWLPACEKYLV